MLLGEKMTKSEEKIFREHSLSEIIEEVLTGYDSGAVSFDPNPDDSSVTTKRISIKEIVKRVKELETKQVTTRTSSDSLDELLNQFRTKDNADVELKA